MSSACKIVILISGRGSNLNAFIEAANKDDCPYEIAAVLSNRPNAGGLDIAANHNIPTHTIDHKRFDSREDFDLALSEFIDQLQVDLIVLAGFMRILTEGFTTKYLGKMLNIHPSLLPLYPGLHTHQRALDSGDSHHGATVHFVTPVLDDGPLIVQSKVAISEDDSAETLANKLLSTEHVIYPAAVKWFAEKKLRMVNNAIVLGESGEQNLVSPVLYENEEFIGPELLCGKE